MDSLSLRVDFPFVGEDFPFLSEFSIWVCQEIRGGSRARENEARNAGGGQDQTRPTSEQHRPDGEIRVN